MSDMKTFASRVAASANRAEYLRKAIEWLEPTSRDTILHEPNVSVIQTWANGMGGYYQAMELLSSEMSDIAEDVAKATLVKAKKELAEIEDIFARFIEQENAP
ncbi:hypothetical protein [Agrobacterium sp. LMR679]|uniref:hypothetical protein n=1 Tax=Agrobacterium sp. LMR679 TaxID=3014335 RepID=UPI0022B06989|nr:hypothetical protein [Agrobacterium sp. LMR679]MCZ4073574.1 hypothetical protein [Agrobacterium sp. LMR679]MCZ4076286.1 hypothetical protein [Agrobacterium sp. LMR679]